MKLDEISDKIEKDLTNICELEDLIEKAEKEKDRKTYKKTMTLFYKNWINKLTECCEKNFKRTHNTFFNRQHKIPESITALKVTKTKILNIRKRICQGYDVTETINTHNERSRWKINSDLDAIKKNNKKINKEIKQTFMKIEKKNMQEKIDSIKSEEIRSPKKFFNRISKKRELKEVGIVYLGRYNK